MYFWNHFNKCWCYCHSQYTFTTSLAQPIDVGLWQFHSSIDHPNILLLYFKHQIEFFLSVFRQLQGLVTRLNILMLKSIKIRRLLRVEEEVIGSFNQKIRENSIGKANHYCSSNDTGANFHFERVGCPNRISVNSKTNSCYAIV